MKNNNFLFSFRIFSSSAQITAGYLKKKYVYYLKTKINDIGRLKSFTQNKNSKHPMTSC